jgi:hypothetical protein
LGPLEPSQAKEHPNSLKAGEQAQSVTEFRVSGHFRKTLIGVIAKSVAASSWHQPSLRVKPLGAGIGKYKSMEFILGNTPTFARDIETSSNLRYRNIKGHRTHWRCQSVRTDPSILGCHGFQTRSLERLQVSPDVGSDVMARSTLPVWQAGYVVNRDPATVGPHYRSPISQESSPLEATRVAIREEPTQPPNPNVLFLEVNFKHRQPQQ